MRRLTELAAALGTLLGLLAVAAMADFNLPQLDTPDKLPAHRRQKRAWIWNQMHIDEEKNSSLPHYVGKVGLGLRGDGSHQQPDCSHGHCSTDGDKYRGGCHWRVTAAKMEVVEVVNMVVIMVTTTTVL